MYSPVPKLDESNISAPSVVNKMRPPLLEEYKSLFLMLLSLLHGVLFFKVADQLVELDYRVDFVESIAWILLCLVVFFRIFQSQVVAALKYDGQWRLKALDFVAVFVVILVEYLLFSSAIIAWLPLRGELLLLSLLSALGVAGYLVTFLRIRSDLNGPRVRRERRIQAINISFSLLISLVSAGGWILSELAAPIYIYAVVSILAIANTLVSMRDYIDYLKGC